MSKQDKVWMDSEVPTVTVIHSENRYPDRSGATHDPDEAVAEVTYSQPLPTYDGKLHEDDLDKVLGYAWRWTNNVDGSWSRKELKLADEDGLLHENGDYNENVKVLLPNPRYEGREMGRRSSMVGDLYILNTEAGSIMYSVDDFGFTNLNDKIKNAINENPVAEAV